MQSSSVGSDGREFKTLGLEVFKKGLAGEFVGTQSKRFKTGADRGGEPQVLIGGPQYDRHSFNHDTKPRTPLVVLELRSFQILEHAIDCGTEISELVLAADFQAGGKIAAGSDLGDPVAQIGDARKYHALEQIKRSGAE